MSFYNKVLSAVRGKIVLTKGVESIEIGKVNIKKVKRYKCPLVVVDTDDYEYNGKDFDADPGKYLIET